MLLCNQRREAFVLVLPHVSLDFPLCMRPLSFYIRGMYPSSRHVVQEPLDAKAGTCMFSIPDPVSLCDNADGDKNTSMEKKRREKERESRYALRVYRNEENRWSM